MKNRDQLGPSVGAVHNIGAGGVNSMGVIAGPLHKDKHGTKRFEQWQKRTNRACGIR